jgi:hypothetical protein
MMTKRENLMSDISDIKKGLNSDLEEKYKVGLRSLLKKKEEELESLKDEKPAEKKESAPKKAEPKKAEAPKKSPKDALANCKELLAKYTKEKASAKKRVETRKKQGKPAELTPSEAVNKTAKSVKSKVVDMKDKGLSSGEIDKLASGIIATIKSTLAGIKTTTGKHAFLSQIRKEITTIDGGLSKVAMEGGLFADGGMMANGGELKKEDIVILGVSRNKITEKEWESILRMAKYQNGGTYLLKDERGLDVVPQVEYEWYVKEKMADGGMMAKGGYVVFNYTDNIYASNEVFKTKREAKEFIENFRNRFNQQGYYRTNYGERIPTNQIDLEVIPEDFNPFRKMADGGMTSVGGTQFSQEDLSGFFRKGGYNRGSAWTLDHYQHNKSEKYEVPTSQRKMEEGGMAGQRDLGEYFEKKKYSYEEGGIVDENTEMLLSQVKEIRHHADEIQKLINNNTEVEAWVVAKAERSATDLSDITHYIDGKNQKFADGGMVKWQDVQVGDSANVKSENKTGVIVHTYGRKFHLKFVDGSEKTYDASELEFFKDDEDEFARGGYNTGRAWTLDHYQHNKSEKYEKPVGDRKYADGGYLSSINESLINLKKNGIVLNADNLTLICYNTGNQSRNLSLYNQSLIYKVVSKINKDTASKIIVNLNHGVHDVFDEDEIDNYKKSKNLIVMNQNEVLYDSANPDIRYVDGGLLNRVEVMFEDPQYNYTTSVASAITEQDARRYFVGKMFDVGSYPNELMKEVIDIRFTKGTLDYANGGDTDDDMEVKFIDYKDKMIMYSPYFNKYYTNDIEFDTMDSAKKYIDSGSKNPSSVVNAYREGLFADGGTTTFNDKVKSIKAGLLKRKKVSPSVRKDYGKTYSKTEALDSAKRIAGAMRKNEMSKKKA